MQPARGFSLVETTVVIGVIVLLAGLAVSAGTAVVRHAEERATTTALARLDGAVRAWELQADRRLTWWNGDDDQLPREAAEVHGDTPEVLIITEILDVITRCPAGRELVAGIDPDLLYRYEDDTAPWLGSPEAKSRVNDQFTGSLTVLDAWGTPIYATHPGRPWVHGEDLPRDDDGTIRTLNEFRYGSAPNRRVVFVSAGPDGLFGLPSEFPFGSMNAVRDARRDNLYSTPVSFPAYGY